MPTRKTSPTRKPTRKSTRRAAPLGAHLAPNAAELWAATLPTAGELAIHAERVRRTDRPAAVCASEVAWTARELDECPSVRPSYAPAVASLALLGAIVAACAFGTGLLQHWL